MILAEDEVSKARAKALAEAEEAAVPAPPAYQASSSSPLLANAAYTAQPYTIPTSIHHAQHHQAHHISRESTPRRFWKAFGVAILIWWLAAMFFGSITRYRRHPSHLPPHFPHGGSGWTDNPGSLPKGITSGQCPHWNIVGQDKRYPNYRKAAKSSFSFPLSSDTIFLFSRGPGSAGAIDIIASDDDSNFAKIDVTVLYDLPPQLGAVSVCEMHRKKNENGVGILTTTEWGRTQNLQFYIAVTIPRHYILNNFETDLSQIRHDVGPDLKFKSISLSSQNSAIHAQSLSADFASISAENGPITGNYATTRSLRLSTANAPVEVSVTLQNNNPDGSGPKLYIKALNAFLSAEVLLEKTTDVAGTYTIDATTSNSPMILTLDPKAPVGANIQLLAKSSNGLAKVHLPPVYEGTILLSTTNSKAMVNAENDPQDPAGKGRERHVQINSERNGFITGQVSWGANDRNTARGQVEVYTSNSVAVLEL